MAAVMTRRDYSHGTEKYPDELREGHEDGFGGTGAVKEPDEADGQVP